MADASEEAHDPMLADEEDILKELQGKTFDKEKFVYKTRDGGFQLSYKGVQMACRAFAADGEVIEIPDLAKVMYDPENKEFILAQVLGRRVRVDQKTGQRTILDSAIGSKRKWFRQKLKDGSSAEDPFFFEKAISQAECAAKRKLLPQDFIIKFVKQILGQKPPQASQGAQGAPRKTGADTKTPQSDSGKSESKSGPPKGSLGALRQQFWAVLKTATKARDDASARSSVEKLTGGTKVSALNEATLKKLGGFLRKVADGEASFKGEGNRVLIVHGPTGDILWPENYQAPAKEEPAPAKEEAPAGAPPGGGDWMF